MTKNTQTEADDHTPCDSRRALTVEFEVVDGGCPVAATHGTTTPIEHNLIDDTCHFTSRSAGDQTAVNHRQARVSGECICRIVARHGCNPLLQAVTEDGLVVRTHPSDRQTLRELIENLRADAETVRIRSLIADNDESASQSGLVNLQDLTQLERETVERAILEGYYDRPREIAFEGLAEELDLTKSALSKRLASAESKIMRDLF